MAQNEGRAGRSGARMDVATRRDLLVDAALDVMREEGVAAATTRAICARAQMPLGAFHYCFRGKAELFQTILDRDLRRGLEEAWSLVDVGAPPAQNLRTVVGAYWSGVEADPLWQLVLSELTTYCLRDPELADLPARDHATFLVQVRAQVEDLLAGAGLDVGAEALAELLIATLQGVTAAWLAHRDGDLARATLELFVQSVAARLAP